MREPYEILNLAKIPLSGIVAFSLSHDAQEQTDIARKIHEEYGMPGLRTLWMCQGLECTTRNASVMHPYKQGLTLATHWWLRPDNEYAALLQKDLQHVVSMDDANCLMGLCTRTPQFDTHAPQNNAMFSPGSCEETSSKLSAVHVRRLIQTFFSHIPDAASPLNPLYFFCYEEPSHDAEEPEREWEPIYHDPNGAFMDDPHALRYLCFANRSLPLNPPDWLVEFATHGDDEWNVYKALGLPPNEAYRLAMDTATNASTSIPLPRELNTDAIVP